MECPYQEIRYRNEYYLINPELSEYESQGFVFKIGNLYESISCALAFYNIGCSTDSLKNLSPTGDLDLISRALNVKVRVFELKGDSWYGYHFIVSRQITKLYSDREIYLGQIPANKEWFVILPWIDAETASRYSSLFYIHKLVY
jgi:hypothetical protein